MTIDGVSQSSGIERLVEVGASGPGVRVAVRDRKLGFSLGQAVVPADALMAALTDPPSGPRPIAADGGSLSVEVRRNEVLLALGGADAAVGLDDLLDAVADALPSGGDE